VLFWGILSALILRSVMIGVGVAFVETFHWALYLFGAFLLFTGEKMSFSRKRAVDIARNPLIRLVRRLLPVSDTYHGARFTVRRDDRRLLTPLTLVLIMTEVTDVLFAVDSIPAIFGITRDPFIVYTSNVRLVHICGADKKFRSIAVGGVQSIQVRDDLLDHLVSFAIKS
jgi:tellurite resistance protein TerC